MTTPIAGIPRVGTMDAQKARMRNWTIVLLMIVLLGCGCRDAQQDQQPELVTYCAASLRDVMDELARMHTERTGRRIITNYASSGSLAQQMLAAPRADLFISANDAWMDRLQEVGLLAESSRIHLLGNQLVIIAAARSGFSLKSLDELPALPFRHLIMGDPQSVPAGTYARQWLLDQRASERTIWDAVEDRIMPAADVRAALAQVEANRETVGIVYKTDYQSRAASLRLLFEPDPAEGVMVLYPAAILATSRQQEAARAWLDFLKSPDAGEVFHRHGFNHLTSRYGTEHGQPD